MRLGRILFCFVAVLFLAGCSLRGTEGEQQYEAEGAASGMESGNMSLGQEALPEIAAIPDVLIPQASGEKVKETERVWIDYSNTADGYVMVCFREETEKRLKVQVKGPAVTYTYSIGVGEWETFPLSDGNGEYRIAVYENVEGSKYALVESVGMTVELTDEFAPFLRPNQYVDYADAMVTRETAARLSAGKETELEKVQAVYEYVVGTLSYDKELAATVQSGYLPELDKVIEKKKGICFDYAALMTGMLRSQSVPCKLVVGYAGTVYHAWISVYTEAEGWIDRVIYFDGEVWKRMDPTFASSGGSSEEIMEFIGDGTNYKEKYLY